MGQPQPPAQNGAAQEDHRDHRDLLGPRQLIDRSEYVRVLEQALRALGYEHVAAQLEAASGVEQQPQQAAAFRGAVLGGDYDAALRLLPAVAADVEVLDRARFLLLRAKYIELMEAGQTAAALVVLRQELQPLHVQQQVLHSLAALLLRAPGTPGSSDGSASQAGSPGGAAREGSGRTPTSQQALAAGRAALLAELQDSLMPSLLIPERRLEELVEQALLSQLDRCQSFNSQTAHLSLFADYQAGADQLPTEAGQLLEEHSSEVWSIVFSSNGRWAASASKDGSALLWSITQAGRFESPRLLLRSSLPCQLVAFSPDSRLLLTATMDAYVRLHDVASAKLLRHFGVSEDAAASPRSPASAASPRSPSSAAAAAAVAGPGGGGGGLPASAVTAVSWFPDSRRFLVATRRGLAVFDAQQAGAYAPLRRLPCPHSFCYDAVVGPGGAYVISVGQDKRIAFMRLSDHRTEYICETGAVTSIHLSPCGRYLTTNLSDSLVHVWQLPESLVRAGAAPGGLSALGSPSSAANGAAGEGLLEDGAAASAALGMAAGVGAVGRGVDPLDALPNSPTHELRMAGAKPSRYVLRSCVGGAHSGFVACGSEDCRVYVWSRRTGELLECLTGHSGCINATAWHPTKPWLLASASDDGTIRTFLAPVALR